MSCCEIQEGGRPGEGGFAPFFSRFPAFTQVGATVGTLSLGVVTNPGDRIVIRGLTISAIFTAGVPAGDIGQLSYAGVFTGQNSTTDGVVSLWGAGPWGPPAIGDVPNNILEPMAVGYQPALNYGVGGIPITINLAGTTIPVQGTGIAGFTTRFDIWGEIYLFGSSTRLV